MCKSFERALVAHCAPTLAGHKCGSMFSWHGCDGTTPAQCVAEAKAALAGKGVELRVFEGPGRGCLIYVWRPGQLAARLRAPGVGAFLAGRGYEGVAPEEHLAVLARRLCAADEFPHEVGIFLDYPLADVIGFIEHRGREYSCLGCWKAYTDAREARRRFALYRKCRAVYMACHSRGFDIARLTVAA